MPDSDYAKNNDRPVTNDPSESAMLLDRASELNKETWEIASRFRKVREKLLPSRPEKGQDQVKTEQAPGNFVDRMKQVQDGQSNAINDLRKILADLEQF